MPETEFSQLSFLFNNGADENIVYITIDPQQNQLELVITSNTNCIFTPGSLVPLAKAGLQQAGSNLYLLLAGLNLTDADFGNLVFSADGWQFQSYVENRAVCMTPARQFDLNSGAANSIKINISKLVLSNPPQTSSAQLTVKYYRVEPITRQNLGRQTIFKVLLQRPPDQHDADLHQVLDIAVSEFNIVNSVALYQEVKNEFSINLRPGVQQREVKPDDKTSFIVTFVYDNEAPGYGALTTPERAGYFTFVRGTNTEGWEITRGMDQQNPSWLLKPPKNKSLLGEGPQAIVSFEVGNVITPFHPGPTLMLVSYQAVPGYQDGLFTILLEKVPHVSIDSMTITPNPTHLSDGKANVEISWQAYHAGTLELISSNEDKDVTGQTHCKADVSMTTSFTLRAQGKHLASAGNIAIKNASVVVQPIINFFNTQPKAVYYTDFGREGHEVDLEWGVNTNGQVEIKSSVTGSDHILYKPADCVKKQVAKPQMFTLSTADAPATAAVTRKSIISAFKALPKTLSFDDISQGFVAAAPQADFIAVSSPLKNMVAIIGTIDFQPIVKLAAGKAPQGIAFAPDGRLMGVANSGDGTITIFHIEKAPTTPPYRFTPQLPITVGGAPQQLAFSCDGTHLFVTVDNSQKGLLLVLKKGNHDQFTRLTTITVGKAPRGLAVMSSGAQIFVANSGSNSVATIGYSQQDGYQLVNTIENLKTPVSVAVTPDCRTLLVVCSDSNQIVAINTENTGGAHFKYLQVGQAPQYIAMSPGGAYAFVTNRGDGTISLLDCWGSSRQCRVVEKAISVCSDPYGVAAAEEGGLVFVTGKTALTVLALAEYEAQTQPKRIGNNPTNVSLSADHTKIFAWNNGMHGMPGRTQPSTGIYVYDKPSQTISHRLEEERIIDCEFSPIPGDNKALFIKQNHSSVMVVNTASYQSVEVNPTIDIPPQTGGEIRYPVDIALASDGRVLFVVAADEQNNYTMLIFAADLKNNQYQITADLTLFTASAASNLVFMTISPNAETAYVTDSVDNRLWIVRQGEDGFFRLAKSPVKVGKMPVAATILPDGSRLYMLNKGGINDSISVVDTANLMVDTVYLPLGQISLNGIAAAPDGEKLFVTDGAVAGIRVIDPDSLRILQTISWETEIANPWGIAVEQDGSQIYTANYNSGNIGIVSQIQPEPLTVH